MTVVPDKNRRQRSVWSTESGASAAHWRPVLKSEEGYFVLRTRWMHRVKSLRAQRNWVCVSIYQRTGAGLVVLARGKRNHVQDKPYYNIPTPIVEGVFSPWSKNHQKRGGQGLANRSFVGASSRVLTSSRDPTRLIGPISPIKSNK